MGTVPISLVGVAVLAAGCPGPQRPQPIASAQTIDATREGGSLRGVAGDEQSVYAAITVGDRTVIEARRSAGTQAVSSAATASVVAVGAVRWQLTLDGTGGPLARSGYLLAAALANTGRAAEVALRGNPGAVLVALDAWTGSRRWQLAIDASEWSLITAIAPTGDGFVVGGSFAGTLRAGSRVVSSAGKSDGFVARVSATGDVGWLVRAGGAHADGISGVAAAGDRIAIAGTFAPTAELLGEPLASHDERVLTADVFVAELAGNGTRRWSATFGGKLDDSVAGIAIDGKGRIAVGATVRDTLRINLADIRVQGPADGLVTYFAPDGTAGPSIPLGGLELDGVRAIAASGDRIVVGGIYTGSMVAGRELVKSGGGEDAFFAILDGGTVTSLVPIAGPGREEVTAFAGLPGGFIAGIAHTAGGTFAGDRVAAPTDPMTGAALLVRPIR